MKMKLQYILGFVWLLLLQACESSMPKYSDTEDGLRFLDADEVLGYSFVYDEEGTKEAVVEFTVQSVGRVTKYDRPFVIRQVFIGSDTLNAEVDKHYVPLSREQCYIPAGEAKCTVALTVLNIDPLLADTIAMLRFELVDNEYFTINMQDFCRRDIQISNMPIEPKNWLAEYYGDYGKNKHHFLIQLSGEKWDEEFLNMLASNYTLRRFWCEKAQRALIAENMEREERGEAPLSEKDGKLVSFPKWW